MPEWFVLDVRTDEGWVDWGFYGRHHFERLEDGSYVCGGYGGSPTFIRCVAHHEEGVDVLDGGGKRHTYRLRPHPPPSQPSRA